MILKIIKKYLKLLEKGHIRYTILRNYDFLLDKNKPLEKDLDILVFREDVPKIKRIFHNESVKESGHVLKITVCSDSKIFSFDFHIDRITGTHTSFNIGQSIMKKRIKKKFFFIPDEMHQIIILILREILSERRFKEKYRTKINQLYDERLDEKYINLLQKYFSRKVALEIMGLIRKKDYVGIENKKNKYLIDYLMKNPSKLLSYVFEMFRAAEMKIKKLKLKPIISFIGMDGSGKTTATNHVVRILNENRVPCRYVYTGRGSGNILPIQFFGRRYKQREKKINEKNGEGKTSAIRKLIYSLAAPVFALDLWLRYWIRIFPKRFKSIVVTDRYSSDMLLMKHVPRLERRLLYVMFPKPKKFFYLYNDVSLLRKRGGHPLEDLKRQEKEFKDINKTLNPVKIKSENKKQTIDKIMQQILKII